MFTNKFAGALLIITGTCVGAGMLGLPVMTASIGFTHSVVILILMWALMCFTGLLVLEVNLWFPQEVSYVSMAKATLGEWGKNLAWVSFLILLYALMVAYLMSGSGLIISTGKLFLNTDLPRWLGILPWVFAFAGLVYSGTSSVDVANKYLMLGLAFFFAALATFIAPHVHLPTVMHVNYNYDLAVLPVVITAFGYHIVVPSLCSYLNGHTQRLRKVIVLGSLFPLLIYIFWQWLVFSIIPAYGDNSLTSILHSGDVAAGISDAIAILLGHSFIVVCIRFFIFFAVASSFLGVALGLFGLLADACNIRKTHVGRLNVAILTFFPPIIFTLVYPQGFLKALGYAGTFVAVLHGILPALMAWFGRKSTLAVDAPYRVFGGKPALVLVFIVSCVVIYAEVAVNAGWI